MPNNYTPMVDNVTDASAAEFNQRFSDLNDALDAVQQTTDPGAGDDSYDVGKVWVRTDRDRVWVCTDNASGSAVWKLVGGEYGASVSMSANQIVTDLSTDKIEFDTADSDPDSLFDGANNEIDADRNGVWRVELTTRVTYSGLANVGSEIQRNTSVQAPDRRDASGTASATMTKEIEVTSAPVTFSGLLFYNNLTNNANNGTIQSASTRLTAYLTNR